MKFRQVRTSECICSCGERGGQEICPWECPHITMNQIMSAARAGKYAVAALNISNLETPQAVIEAAREERLPVIVAVAPEAIEYIGLKYLTSVAKVATEFASVPAVLHLIMVIAWRLFPDA